MKGNTSRDSICVSTVSCSGFRHHPQRKTNSTRSAMRLVGARRYVLSCCNWTLVKSLSTMSSTKGYYAMTHPRGRNWPQYRPRRPGSPRKPRHMSHRTCNQPRHHHQGPPSSVLVVTNPDTPFSSVLYATSSATPRHMSWPTANTTCCRKRTHRQPLRHMCMGSLRTSGSNASTTNLGSLLSPAIGDDRRK